MPGSYPVGGDGVVNNDEVPVRVIQNNGGHRRDADTPEHEPWPGEMPIDSECWKFAPWVASK
jgi:hypothetical protein